MKSLRTIWSSTDFGASELTRYASAVFTGSPVAKTTSNSRGSGSGWISLARATSPVGFSTHRRNYDNELMSGDFECGNPTGDALDKLRQRADVRRL